MSSSKCRVTEPSERTRTRQGEGKARKGNEAMVVAGSPCQRKESKRESGPDMDAGSKGQWSGSSTARARGGRGRRRGRDAGRGERGVAGGVWGSVPNVDIVVIIR